MGSKQSKKAAMARIERGEVKGATVIKDSGETRHLKSSTAFFAKLQDDVRTQVSRRCHGDIKALREPSGIHSHMDKCAPTLAIATCRYYT
jgi:hypothetical protein